MNLQHLRLECKPEASLVRQNLTQAPGEEGCKGMHGVKCSKSAQQTVDAERKEPAGHCGSEMFLYLDTGWHTWVGTLLCWGSVGTCLT